MWRTSGRNQGLGKRLSGPDKGSAPYSPTTSRTQWTGATSERLPVCRGKQLR